MISLLILLTLLLIIYWNLFIGRYKVFTTFYIVLLCFYDYLFIEISYILPNSLVFLLKPFQETSFLCILLLLIYRYGLKIPLKKEYYRFYFCIILPLIIVLLNSILSQFTISSIILGFRHFFLVPLIVLLFYSNNILSFNKKILYFLLLILVIYAAYQSYTFNGNLSKLWFYRFYQSIDKEDLIIKGSFNYVKDGVLRCTSLFTSSIEFSSTCAILGLFFTSKYLFKRKVVDLAFIFLSVYGLLLSHTRIGLTSFILGIGIIIIYRYSDLYRLPLIILACPLLYILLTFAFIILNPTIDLSASGRLVQYTDFPSLIFSIGKGIGIEQNVLDYDSFILSSINVLGIFGIVYLIFYFFSVYDMTRKIRTSSCAYSYENVFAVSSGCCLIFMFAFHHLAGSFIGSFILILIYSSLGGAKNKKHEKKVIS